MDLHSRGLTEEAPILLRAHFSLFKTWEMTSTDPLSLYLFMEMPDSPPLAKLIRILEARLPADQRQKDTWKSTPAQGDRYVTRGFLWFWVHPD